MTRFLSFCSALFLTVMLSACVVSSQPPSERSLLTVEARKMEIARMRDQGRISYEEAARRQFSIQRHAYALTDGEMAFWRASIHYAMLVDRHQITPAEYHRRVKAAHFLYVEKPKGKVSASATAEKQASL